MLSNSSAYSLESVYFFCQIQRELPQICIRHQVKCPPFSSDFKVKLEFYRQFFQKYSNTQFHKIPSSFSRVVPCGATELKKLIVALSNFANAPKRRGIQIEGFGKMVSLSQKWPSLNYNIKHLLVRSLGL
jgi:hypothetical protein